MRSARLIGKTGAQRGHKEFLRHVEEHAAELRRRAGVGPEGMLDPRRLANELRIRITNLDEIRGVDANDRDHLRSIDPKVWSGAGLPLPDGWTLIILHPGQTLGRAAATIMEEVCHAYFGHSPSQFVTLPGGIVKREYDAAAEQEAYWTAAAALLPAYVVARAVWRNTPVDLPAAYGVSVELVEFRIKTLGLWRDYRGKAA